MEKINNQYINYNTSIFLTVAHYFFSSYIRNSSRSKTFFYNSLFCLIGSMFFLSIGIDFKGLQQEQEYHSNIVNMAWAENLNGTENADNITGTINQDIIRGFGGNDTLAGKEAGDDISGGSGDDTIYGNEGRDVLKGKSGNDHIEGGEGQDRIYGDRGNDMLMGGAGNDTLSGGPGKDIFICGPATDTITDFNITQKDTIPENDCENIKSENSTNVSDNINNGEEMPTEDTITTTKEQEKSSGDGFFGLFK